ncbi:YncE family protein [Saccharopolyspora taberi]|uniref:YncE family protein n=1 Tax=Saccharopolyspora taberi TaxID=60895 RepID=A0ABN3VJ71_9PSEU
MRNGDVLAVVSQSGPTVNFFDAVTHELLDVLEVPAEPHELCFDPDHRILYCTNAYHSGYYHANSGRARELVVIDPDQRRIIDSIDLSPEHGPHGLALDRGRQRLYISVEATDELPGGVVVLDTGSRERVGRIDTMAPGPHWFDITPDGRRGFATNKEAPYVSVVDLETDTFLARVEVPGSEGLAITPDGKHVCVATPYGDFAGDTAEPGIRIIDTATNAVIRTLPLEHQVFPVHVTSTGLLLVGEVVMSPGADSTLGVQESGRLSVFAPETYELLGTVEVGKFPLTTSSSPDGSRAYVSAAVSSTVAVVDLENLELVGELPVARKGEPGAHGLAYVPSR